MKKLLAIVLAGVLLFAFAACGGKDDNAAAVKEYVDVLVASDEFKETISSSQEAGMSLVVEARGDDIAYKFTYTIELPDGADELLKKSIEDSDDILAATADTIRKDVPEVDKVIWEYCSSDGKVIASAEK